MRSRINTSTTRFFNNPRKYFSNRSISKIPLSKCINPQDSQKLSMQSDGYEKNKRKVGYIDESNGNCQTYRRPRTCCYPQGDPQDNEDKGRRPAADNSYTG